MATKDTRITAILDLINARIPTGVILFEAAKEADNARSRNELPNLMYTVVLRELGYSEDFEVAESPKTEKADSLRAPARCDHWVRLTTGAEKKGQGPTPRMKSGLPLCPDRCRR
jgi:hypothetical protein